MAKFYLSSTFLDLRECREKVSDTLRQMGHTVIGMEDYAADGRPPLEKVLADIGECDAYLGIFAWRYGYIPKKDNPLKQAITELEYREAVRLEKEPLIFILRNDAPWPGEHQPQDDKERKRIHALRNELSQAHSPARFRDSDDLATKVSVAVSRFLVKRREGPPPPPPPIHDDESRPAATRLNHEREPVSRVQVLPWLLRWKWYFLLAIVAVAAALFLAYKISARYGSEGTSTLSGPTPYPTEKKYDFFLTERETLPETWRLVPGYWSLEKGEGAEDNDGALLIGGSQMAIPKDLGGKAFYDHTADLKVRFREGDKANWVLWAQEDGQSGYLFELRKAGGTVFLKGWVLKNNKIFGDPLSGDKPLVFSQCCKQTDALHVIADVTNTAMTGTRIKFHIAYRSDPGYVTKDTATFDDALFVDSSSTFKWGSIGLLVFADRTSPEAGGVMKVEHVYLTPRTGEMGRAAASPDGSAP